MKVFRSIFSSYINAYSMLMYSVQPFTEMHTRTLRHKHRQYTQSETLSPRDTHKHTHTHTHTHTHKHHAGSSMIGNINRNTMRKSLTPCHAVRCFIMSPRKQAPNVTAGIYPDTGAGQEGVTEQLRAEEFVCVCL